MSEMDSGSIVFAGRTGRGGKTSGGEPEGNASGSGAGDVEVEGWKVADAERHGGGCEVLAMAGERPAFREIFLRGV